MDLQNIQEQLNTEFAKQETRIVFWFDDKAEYESEVEELELGNVKLHILDGSNWFYSKWLLNEAEPETKFLVYAPFARPSDAENPLADMYYYSTPYYTDRVSQMSQEIGIDSKYKEHLSKYSNFWKNKKRIESFKALEIDHFNQETIDIGLIAVLTDVKTPNFEEIIKQLIFCDNAEYMKAIENNGLMESFWMLCKKYFGYEAEKTSIGDLAACLVVTYASVSLKASLPNSLKNYVLKKKNDVVVFVRNIMDNMLTAQAYDELSEKIDKVIRCTAKLKEDLEKEEMKKNDSAAMSDVVSCDAFKGIDELIIRWMLDKLDSEILDAQIEGMSLAQIAEQRSSKVNHFADAFTNEYAAIKNAYLLIKNVSIMDFSGNVIDLVNRYQKEMYMIDSYYRWFYYAYDKIEDNEKLSALREKIENIYANQYLARCVPKWNELFVGNDMENVGLIKQTNFYNHYLRNYEGNDRVIVIISDALRYECAKELMERFELDEKCDAKIDAMIGVLPSVTEVGMASLLPGNSFEVQVKDGKLKAFVDGKVCEDTAARDKQLKSKNENNIAVTFDDLFKVNKAAVRELLQGKNIVYVYHNQVDARGDKPASENEVFNACGEAIDEIIRLIRKLTGDVSATKFIVTADHGFLYRRDKLKASDKITIPRELCVLENKRFLMTTEDISGHGFVSRVMAYAVGMSKMFVTTPIGADIFSAAGAGQNYVHGGSSLQEMIVPVVEVKTLKGKQQTDFVDVILTSASRKVTNLITFFDFIQTEKVTDVMKARSLVAYFADESGEKISFDVPLVANSREDNPEKRVFHEKFTLKSREYKYGDKYYMHIVDANDDKNIIHSYEFMIDIAFVDDFGF